MTDATDIHGQLIEPGHVVYVRAREGSGLTGYTGIVRRVAEDLVYGFVIEIEEMIRFSARFAPADRVSVRAKATASAAKMGPRWKEHHAIRAKYLGWMLPRRKRDGGLTVTKEGEKRLTEMRQQAAAKATAYERST